MKKIIIFILILHIKFSYGALEFRGDLVKRGLVEYVGKDGLIYRLYRLNSKNIPLIKAYHDAARSKIKRTQLIGQTQLILTGKCKGPEDAFKIDVGIFLKGNSLAFLVHDESYSFLNMAEDGVIRGENYVAVVGERDQFIMTMYVMIDPDKISQTHQFIVKSPEFARNTEPRYRGLSVKLHKFAAQATSVLGTKYIVTKPFTYMASVLRSLGFEAGKPDEVLNPIGIAKDGAKPHPDSPGRMFIEKSKLAIVDGEI